MSHLFDFFKGPTAKVTGKTTRDNQILFDETKKTLYFDIAGSGSDPVTVIRYDVRDPEVQSKLEGQTILVL